MHLEITAGDITAVAADALVNAANERLVLGSGVAGAIRAKGGPAIQAECDALAPIATGEAVVTGAGELPHRAVIHAVAPRIEMPDWETLLARCMTRVLTRADEQQLRHIGVPALGTGVFGLPLDRAARILLAACQQDWRGRYPEKVTFCLFGDDAYAAFTRAWYDLSTPGT